MSERIERPWCVCNRCARRARPGWPVCEYHLGMLHPGQRPPIRGVSAVGLIHEPASEATVAALELIAEAVEAVSILERGAVVNTYRLRANVLRSILARAEPAPVQGRLIEDHPDTGAYGARGRER